MYYHFWYWWRKLRNFSSAKHSRLCVRNCLILSYVSSERIRWRVTECQVHNKGNIWVAGVFIGKTIFAYLVKVFPAFSEIRMSKFPVYKRLPFNPAMIQRSLFHNLISCYFNVYLNIIALFKPRTPNVYLSFGFFQLSFCMKFSSSHVCIHSSVSSSFILKRE